MMISFNKSAQSVLEYLFLISVVISAMIIMGPYIVKSVNGMIRTYEDGIRDSFREDLNECPRNQAGCPAS